jgi:hypothetical protein
MNADTLNLVSQLLISLSVIGPTGGAFGVALLTLLALKLN